MFCFDGLYIQSGLETRWYDEPGRRAESCNYAVVRLLLLDLVVEDVRVGDGRCWMRLMVWLSSVVGSYVSGEAAHLKVLAESKESLWWSATCGECM